MSHSGPPMDCLGGPPPLVGDVIEPFRPYIHPLMRPSFLPGTRDYPPGMPSYPLLREAKFVTNTAVFPGFWPTPLPSHIAGSTPNIAASHMSKPSSPERIVNSEEKQEFKPFFGMSSPRLGQSPVTPLHPFIKSRDFLPNLTPPMTPTGLEESLPESAARLLFMTVRWARGLPAFLSLPFRDQAILLEEGWCDLFVLGAAQWALPVENGCIALQKTVDVPHDQMTQIVTDMRFLQDVLQRLKSLRIDATEYACLKALSLFRPDVRGLRETGLTDTLQDETQLLLSEYINSTYPSDKTRFGKLLLLLPSVRSIHARSVEEVFFRITIGKIPIERVLGDMFKST